MKKLIAVFGSFLLLSSLVHGQEIWPYQPPKGGDALQLFQQLQQKGDVQSMVHANHLFDYCANQQAGTPVVEVKLENCAALLKQTDDMRALWEQLASVAEQGNTQALLAYSEPARVLLQGNAGAQWMAKWKKRAFKLLQQAALKGEVPAAMALAKHYRMGVMVPADPVQSLAWAMVVGQMMHAPENPQVQAFMNSLPPEQQEKARALSKTYLSQIQGG